MRIEKKYYDLCEAEWDAINEEVRREQESLTEAEKKADEQKTKADLQEIYRKYEEYTRNWQRVPDESQIQLFQKLSMQALWLAKLIGCNIVVEDEKSTLGKIILEAESFTLPSSEDHKLNKIFSHLFLMASDIFIGKSSEKLYKMEFWFNLYKEVPTDPTRQKANRTL